MILRTGYGWNWECVKFLNYRSLICNPFANGFHKQLLFSNALINSRSLHDRRLHLNFNFRFYPVFNLFLIIRAFHLFFRTLCLDEITLFKIKRDLLYLRFICICGIRYINYKRFFRIIINFLYFRNINLHSRIHNLISMDYHSAVGLKTFTSVSFYLKLHKAHTFILNRFGHSSIVQLFRISNYCFCVLHCILFRFLMTMLGFDSRLWSALFSLRSCR